MPAASRLPRHARSRSAALCGLALALGLSACAPRHHLLAPPDGGYRQTYNTRISGREVAEFIVPGRLGQDLTLILMTDAGAQFDVYPPFGAAPLFSSAIGETAFSTHLDADGPYTIRVYLAGAAMRAGIPGNFTLDIVVTDPAA